MKPDPLGLESSQPFKGPLSSRNTTKLKSAPYIKQEHNEIEEDCGDLDRRRLAEEFEAEYDCTNQREDQRTQQVVVEKMPAETTDSGESENEVSSDSNSDEEKDYVGHLSATIPHQEESSYRGNKRCIKEEGEVSSRKRKNNATEDVDVEEGEVNDDGDSTQVSSI